MTRFEYATQYAADFGLAPQREDETDPQFHERIVGQLREAGHMIEAHEVQSGERFDGPSGRALDGITGAMAMTLTGREFARDGYGKVGDEIAAGAIVRHRKPDPSPDLMLAMMDLFGRK